MRARVLQFRSIRDFAKVQVALKVGEYVFFNIHFSIFDLQCACPCL